MTTQSRVAASGNGAAAAAAPPDFDLDAPEWYANRELSWLDFNDRVLAEARDRRNPLLERLKFLAITGSNLDEFYAKRIGWLRRLAATDRNQHTLDGMSVTEQLAEAKRRCVAMREEIDELWEHDLRPALAAAGVEIVSYDDLGAERQAELAAHFKQAILPILTPLVVDPAHPFPFISGGSLSLAVGLRLRNGMTRFARVKVPPNRPRFLDLGGGRFVPLEEVIGAHLGLLFAGVEVLGWRLVRVLRSAEVGTPGEAAEDLRELIETQIERRRLADAVALECSSSLPALHREMLLDQLELDESDVIEVDHFVDTADLMQLAALDVEELSFAGFAPTVPPRFASFEHDAGRLWETLRERDLLVHHPYESFDATVVRFVQQAAHDPQVLAIKQTLYRTSPDSPILEALMTAASKGQAGRRRRRADGELRRGEQHRVGAQAGRRGRPHLVRLARPQGAQQDLAGRARRAAGRAALRPHRHRQLQLDHRPPLHRHRPVHLRRRHRRRPRDRVQPLHRLLGAPGHRGADRRADEDARRVRAPHPPRDRARPRRPPGAAGVQDERAGGPRVGAAALRGVDGRGGRRPDRARPLPAAARHPRPERAHPRRQRDRALPGARAHLLLRERRRPRVLHRQRRPDEAQPRRAHRDHRPVREPDLRARLWHVLQTELRDPRQAWRLHDDTWTRDESCDEPGVHAALLAQAPFA